MVLSADVENCVRLKLPKTLILQRKIGIRCSICLDTPEWPEISTRPQRDAVSDFMTEV